jgi:hypothetical protein
MGGLVYLRGSDALGRRMEPTSAGSTGSPREEQISAYNKNMDKGWLTQTSGRSRKTPIALARRRLRGGRHGRA